MAVGSAKPQGLEILLGMGKPKPGSSGPAMGDDDGDEMASDDAQPDELLVGAAQEVMDALHSRDAESFASALKSFVDMAG